MSKKIIITQSQATILGHKNVGVKYKITKEQYNRVFVNTTQELSEDNISNDDTLELIKYLYRKTDQYPKFLEDKEITYNELCDFLTEKGVIIDKNGKHELSKSFGDKDQTIKNLGDVLKDFITSKTTKISEDENITPMDNDMDISEPKQSKDDELTPIAFNDEIVILKNKIDNSLYVYYYDSLDKSELKPYAYVPRTYTGKDEDGQPEYDYDDEFEIDGDVIANYLNDNTNSIEKGDGLGDYENGVDLVKIDDSLKNYLINLYDKDKNILNVLSKIDESETPNLFDKFKDNIKQATIKKDISLPKSKIVDKLLDLKNKEKERREKEKKEIEDRKNTADLDEMTSAASSGAFTTKLGDETIKRDLPNVPVVGETTTSSAGNFQYDTPGLANIGPNGEFKKGGKTKPQLNTQYPNGSFVKIDDCTKLNNNKEAQNGKCSDGSIDSVVKEKKTTKSIISPSLSENNIEETTPKLFSSTLEKIKNIIDNKS